MICAEIGKKKHVLEAPVCCSKIGKIARKMKEVLGVKVGLSALPSFRSLGMTRSKRFE